MLSALVNSKASPEDRARARKDASFGLLFILFIAIFVLFTVAFRTLEIDRAAQKLSENLEMCRTDDYTRCVGGYIKFVDYDKIFRIGYRPLRDEVDQEAFLQWTGDSDEMSVFRRDSLELLVLPEDSEWERVAIKHQRQFLWPRKD